MNKFDRLLPFIGFFSAGLLLSEGNHMAAMWATLTGLYGIATNMWRQNTEQAQKQLEQALDSLDKTTAKLIRMEQDADPNYAYIRDEDLDENL